MKNLATRLFRLTVVIPFLLAPQGSRAQTPADSIVGTWNVTGTQNGAPIVIAVMTFNQGGTTIEFDTSGTNSSASPGESIDLGTWGVTGNRSYMFKEQNYIYDASGNLSQLAVGKCDIALARTSNRFTGSCTLNFYSCSLAQCPGSLQVGPINYDITARRF